MDSFFKSFVSPHTLTSLPVTAPILVGFSGGADSRFLLHLLCLYAKGNGSQIFAAHLNHGIRGSEALRDEQFCRKISAEYDIELFVERADIPSRCINSGNSIELEARLCRYEFFNRIMQERGIPILATAHNADDVLETVLFRLLRGTGTRGLAAIPPVRSLGGERWATRPILSYTKEEIISHCRDLGLEFVTDSTNFENDCTRNKIRHNVIPELEAISGKGIPQRSAVRLATSAAEDEDVIASEAQNILSKYVKEEGLPLCAVYSTSTAVAKRMICESYAALFHNREVPEDKSLSSTHIDAILSLCKHAVKHSRLSLPCGAVALIEDDSLLFFDGIPPTLRTSAVLDQQIPRKIDVGITDWDIDIKILAEILPSPEPPLEFLSMNIGGRIFASVILPCENKILMPIYARRRKEGDKIYCHGMTKKLKKLLCDKHIPLYLRDRLPLFLLSDSETADLLWYPNVAVRDGFAPQNSGQTLRLTVILACEDRKK